MTRPKKPRNICCIPSCYCFVPKGMCNKTSVVTLLKDELEAIKLHDVDGLPQKDASKKMNISQPTFARILISARKKIAGALVKGEKIQIN